MRLGADHKIKVIIADDNSFMSERMKIILNTYEEADVMGKVSDGVEAASFCLGILPYRHL